MVISGINVIFAETNHLMEDINRIISQYREYSTITLVAKLQKETEAIYSKRISILGYGVKITLSDIEVYRQDAEYDDNSVHANDKQKGNYGHLYIHRYGKSADSKRSYAGVDFCLSNDRETSYSWLLRGVTIEKDGDIKYYQGPMIVLKAIMDITGKTPDELEGYDWKIVTENVRIPFFFTRRVNLGSTVKPIWKEAPLR